MAKFHNKKPVCKRVGGVSTAPAPAGFGSDEKGLPSSTRAKTAYGGISVGFGIAQAINDTGPVQVIRTHFHFDSIAYCYLDKVFSQLARDVGQYLVPIGVGQFYPEHGSRQNRHNFSFDLYGILICHLCL